MYFGKTITVSAILAIVATASVRAADPQVPHTFTAGSAAKASEVNENFAFLAGRGKVYFKKSTAYGDSGGAFSASSYTTLDTLTLPQGSYLLSAKLSVHTDDNHGWYVFSCGLFVGDEGDWVGADGEGVHTGADSVVSMQVPVTVTASSGTAYVQCRVNDGQNGAGTGPVGLVIWGLKIAAVQVASVVSQ